MNLNTCEICGKQFEAKSTWKKICSKNCYQMRDVIKATNKRSKELYKNGVVGVDYVVCGYCGLAVEHINPKHIEWCTKGQKNMEDYYKDFPWDQVRAERCRQHQINKYKLQQYIKRYKEGVDYVKCRYCGKLLKYITNSHIKKCTKGQKTFNDYKKEFPEAPRNIKLDKKITESNISINEKTPLERRQANKICIEYYQYHFPEETLEEQQKRLEAHRNFVKSKSTQFYTNKKDNKEYWENKGASKSEAIVLANYHKKIRRLLRSKHIKKIFRQK